MFKRVLVDFSPDHQLIGRLNPTEEDAICLADGEADPRSGALPPADQVWIPQLYQLHGLREASRISGVPVARVRQILEEQGVPLRRPGRPRKEQKAS